MAESTGPPMFASVAEFLEWLRATGEDYGVDLFFESALWWAEQKDECINPDKLSAIDIMELTGAMLVKLAKLRRDAGQDPKTEAES